MTEYKTFAKVYYSMLDQSDKCSTQIYTSLMAFALLRVPLFVSSRLRLG
jgi:hypothetical protein